MNVLSLFDGMSCGKVALEKSNIKIKNYYASEIDKYAIQVSQKNHPDIVRLGDITKWRTWDIDWKSIDLLLAGSPCQGFSFAGKQLNFEDHRSKLFFEFVDILNHIKKLNPNVNFLLENVKMKKEYQDIISEKLNTEPILINSNLVSAQNRRRLYWANWFFGQPENKNILLKDIIENGIVDKDKSYCLDANHWKKGNLKQYFEKSRRQIVFNDDKITERFFQKKKDTLAYKKAISQVVVVAGKSNCLTTSGQNISNSGSSNLLYKTIEDKFGIRFLSPIECERLQTLPDNYTEGVSNTQRYKMLGNGWTVDVIAHVFKGLLNENL